MKGYGQDVELVSPPRSAEQFELYPDGSFLYGPRLPWSDAFTYRITDCSGNGREARVVLQIMTPVGPPFLRDR